MASDEIEINQLSKKIKVDLEESKNGNDNNNKSVTNNGCGDSDTNYTAVTVDLNADESSTNPQISKRQQKKLRKMQQWQEKKKEKRLKEREKCKMKRLEAIARGESINLGPTRKQLKKNKSETSTNFLDVVVDLDFDDLMIDKDIAKCVKQLLRIYTINRRSESPAKLYFCGIKENGRIHNCLKKNDGYQNWDVRCHFQSFSNVLPLQKLVYLTSDSDNILLELDKDAIYIIGGIVDHNHHKGLCLDKAKRLGLKTARLPLTKFVNMQTRHVLSTYHVFEILLRISEGKGWTETILSVLPARKGINPKVESEENLEIEK